MPGKELHDAERQHSRICCRCDAVAAREKGNESAASAKAQNASGCRPRATDAKMPVLMIGHIGSFSHITLVRLPLAPDTSCQGSVWQIGQQQRVRWIHRI